jgi:hypothetical protein
MRILKKRMSAQAWDDIEEDEDQPPTREKERR